MIKDGHTTILPCRDKDAARDLAANLQEQINAHTTEIAELI